MNYTVKRINVGSLARHFFFVSLIPSIAALVVLFAATPRPSRMYSVEWILITVVGCVGLTISLSLAVAICTGLLAMLYNLGVKFSGGVKVYVEFDEKPQQYAPEKLKNDL